MKLKNVFYNLFQNIASCYKKWNLFWQIIFCLLTYVLVVSGFDFWYFLITRGNLIQTLSFPAVLIGMFVPVFAPLCFYIYGKFRKSFLWVNASYSLAQSAILGLGISSVYKVFTGRLGPHGLQNMTNLLANLTDQFRFGIFRGGAFQGWPSSHTTVAFAMAWALIYFLPEKKWVKYPALIYAFYIGLGVSTTIHWFSDFTAGAILGSIIGIAVGRSFYKKVML